MRIATLATALALMEGMRGDPIQIRRGPEWGDLPEGFGWGPQPSRRNRRNRRNIPNEYHKSKATKRRRARNRMAAESRRRNRKG